MSIFRKTDIKFDPFLMLRDPKKASESHSFRKIDSERTDSERTHMEDVKCRQREETRMFTQTKHRGILQRGLRFRAARGDF